MFTSPVEVTPVLRLIISVLIALLKLNSTEPLNGGLFPTTSLLINAGSFVVETSLMLELNQTNST
jgi:hypothetical protein